MNSRLEKEFDPYLLPNEAILWVGESKQSDINTVPSELQIFSSFNSPFQLFGIMPIIVFTFIICGMISVYINISFIYIFIPVLLVGLAVFYWRKRKKPKANNSIFSAMNTMFNPASRGNAIYAMTDKRMLIRTGTNNKELTAIALNSINSMKLIEHDNHLYSISLVQVVPSSKTGRMIPRVAGMIQGVENGLELYKLLNAHINSTV